MPEISIDFLLGPGILSRSIAWYGQGPNGWSHSANVLADGRYLDARDDQIAGVPPGVHIRLPETERCIRKTRMTLSATQGEYDAWEANLRAKITTGYDQGAIIGFITGHAKHLAGHWICSALPINALQHIRRVPFPLSIPAHQITPNVCKLILEVIGGKASVMPPVL